MRWNVVNRRPTQSEWRTLSRLNWMLFAVDALAIGLMIRGGLSDAAVAVAGATFCVFLAIMGLSDED